jgi:ABC-type antimicrobial peptide transport system permease subunit
VSLQDQNVPVIFKAFAQEEPVMSGGPLILARSSAPAPALEVIRRTVSAIDPTLVLKKDPPTAGGLPNARLLSSQLVALVAPQRLTAILLAALAGLALCVSAVGIYGNVAYVVDRRTTELAIRMAIGAAHQDILILILRDVALAIGIGFLRQYLYDQSAGAGVIAFLMAALSICVASSLAAMVPVGRALRINPARTVRHVG